LSKKSLTPFPLISAWAEVKGGKKKGKSKEKEERIGRSLDLSPLLIVGPLEGKKRKGKGSLTEKGKQ